MDVAELLGGFAAGLILALIEHFRHRETRSLKETVIAGVEHATRELERTENKTPEVAKRDKGTADLVKVHIRSVAIKKRLETRLNIDVRRIQDVIRAVADAKAEPESGD